MDDRRIGRAILVLRQRRGWRQEDLGSRAGVSASAISNVERGHLDRYTLATIRRVLHALDASGELDVMWGGRRRAPAPSVSPEQEASPAAADLA